VTASGITPPAGFSQNSAPQEGSCPEPHYPAGSHGTGEGRWALAVSRPRWLPEAAAAVPAAVIVGVSRSFPLAVVAATLARFTITSFAGVNPAWATFGGAFLLTVRSLARRKVSLSGGTDDHGQDDPQRQHPLGRLS
jgi:hypothetical protein